MAVTAYAIQISCFGMSGVLVESKLFVVKLSIPLALYSYRCCIFLLVEHLLLLTSTPDTPKLDI